jgi:hypothetical protein
MTSPDPHAQVADYLRRLDLATAALRPRRRARLIKKVTRHITTARAKAVAAGGDVPASIVAALERLGSPEDIAGTGRWR